MENEAENKLVIKYRSNRGSLRSKLNREPENTAVSIQEGEEMNLDKIDKFLKNVEDSPKEGIEIYPKFMSFKNTGEGLHCRKRLTIKNTGLKVACIEIHQPTSLAFHVTTVERRTILRPGLSLQAWVTYFFRRSSLLEAYLPIRINEDTIKYRLVSVISSPHIDVEPNFIDFETVDVNFESKLKTVTIKNNGERSTRFAIDVSNNDIDIVIMPMRGIIEAGGKIKLKVKIIGMKEGTFHSGFWIKSCQNILVSLKVTMITPKFEADHPNVTGNYLLIDFSETFLNNLKYETFIVRNTSARSINFLVLGEVNEELVNISEIDESKYPVYSIFKVSPVEGSMKPLESKIFNVTFFPTPKAIHPSKKEQSLLAIFKILRFYVSEVKENDRVINTFFEESSQIIRSSQIGSTSLMSKLENVTFVNEADSDSIFLCIHGKVERAQLIFVPDKLYFEDIKVGEKATRMISISNPSTANTLLFRFAVNSNARCTPKEGVLKPKSSLQLLIEVKGKIELKPTFSLKFEATAKTFSDCPSLAMKSRNVLSFKIKCFLNLRIESRKESKPKLIRGFDSISEKELCNVIKFPKIRSDLSLVKPPEKIESRPIKSNIKSLVSLLSTSELYKIKITPATLHFGKIASHSISYKLIYFENKNEFPIKIRLISAISKNIVFSGETLIILDAKATITKFIELYAKLENTISGYFSYIINDNHLFQIKFTADIVEKYLKMNKKEVLFRKECLEESYRPNFIYIEVENELNVDIGFTWKIEAEAGFKIKPLSGLVRANKKLFIHVSCDPHPFKRNQTKALMVNESNSNTFLKLKMQLSSPKVTFLENYLDFGKVPLNIPVGKIAVLYNSEYSPVTFEVDLNSLIYGISVHPSHGIIRPRGIKILQITLNFEACVEFTKYISVTVQKSLHLKLKVTGQVCFPNLKLITDQIKMKRVGAGTRKVQSILATNQGETKLKLRFILNKYPEFSISHSPDEDDFLKDDNEIIIDPSSTQELYLHFNPIHPICYYFNLPILINGIIGPTNLEDPTTLKPEEYLKSKEDEYAKVKGISIMKLPEKLNNICIDCSVTDHIIVFNNLAFKFNTSIDMIEDEFSLFNRSEEESSFIIRTDSFKKETCFFCISWIDGKEPRITPDSIVGALLPKEGSTFKISFQPEIEGYFRIETPIFVGEKLEENMYHTLKLEGNNPKSTIDSQINEIYFNPLPLHAKSIQTFTITTKNFKYNGKMMVNILTPERKIGSFTNETLQVFFPRKNSIPKGQKKELEVSIQLSNPEPVSFCTKVKFFDEKKISSLIITVYGNVDNSLLTTYGHEFQKCEYLIKSDIKIPNEKFVNLQKSVFLNTKEVKENPCNEYDLMPREAKDDINLSYHYFPIKNKNYETFMKKSLTASEEWLFSEVLNFDFFPDINENTTIVSDIFKKSKNVQFQSINKKIDNYSFFTILELIIGPSFRSFIKMPDQLPENTCERIALLLQKYSEMLEFLCRNGAFLVHVFPIFLLSYNDYLIIEQSKKFQTLKDEYMKNKMPKETFEFHSTQCWLDIILQTYKCFKLVEIKENSFIEKTKNNGNRHFSERILLAWLQYHFEQESEKEWLQSCNDVLRPDDQDDKLQPKLISNFDNSLSDALVFIAVTGAYCPFLIEEFFKNIYIRPRRPEEALHNAICVVAAWKKIRLAFIVKPKQIIRPNCVHMLMLVKHLHTELETYLPKTKVEFGCSLSKSITKEITVTNPTENPVNFVAQFFQNDLALFSIVPSKKIFKLNSRQKKKISIKFEARKFLETRVYLIFCGSAIGPYFAPSQTFFLEGISKEFTIVDEQTITSKMYEIQDILIPIKVPCKNEAIYNISIAEDQPKDLTSLKMTLWTEMQKKKVPRRIFLNQKCLAVIENAFSANLSVTIGCKTPQSKSYWFIFQSEFCDFIIKIVSISRAPILQPILVPWTLDICTCPNPPYEINRNCPLNIKIKIPSRNTQLWGCVKQMLKKTLNSKEWCFWSRVLDTSFGVKIIQWNLSNRHDSSAEEISHLFESYIYYNVSTSDEISCLSVPDKLLISDINKPEVETDLVVHISQSTPQIHETVLKLKSLNGKEIRNYKIRFLCQL